MAKYTVRFSCGHTAEVSLYGKTSERERKISWYENSGICPECYKKEKDEKQAAEYQEMLSWAAERKLPDLSGSEAQVHYGVKIRDKIIKELEGIFKRDLMKKISDEDKENEIMMRRLVRNGLYKEPVASYWIQIRDMDPVEIVREWYKTQEKKKTEEGIRPVKEESTIRPQEQKTATIAEIRVLKNRIEIHSDKDQIIIDSVKKAGYRWDGEVWYFHLDSMTGTPADRVAEIGNRLLCDGIPVIIYDPIMRKKAVSGDFEPRYDLWIYNDLNYGLVATWPYGKNYYEKAKSITGSRWESGIGMKLNPIQYKIIRDFADAYDFRITAGAEKVLGEAEKNALKISKVNPVAVEKKVEAENKLESILHSSRDILDDLRDD